MALWTCPDPSCRALNGSAQRLCEHCGTERPSSWPQRQGDAARPPSEGSGMFRRIDSGAELAALRARWQPPETPCTEPGCTKTAGEHIAEFRAIMHRWAAKQDRMARRLKVTLAE